MGVLAIRSMIVIRAMYTMVGWCELSDDLEILMVYGRSSGSREPNWVKVIGFHLSDPYSMYLEHPITLQSSTTAIPIEIEHFSPGFCP